MLEARTSQLVILGGTLAAGLAGTAVAVANRGGEEQFVATQRNPPALAAPAVQRVVRSAPDPFTGKGAGTSATCAKHGRGLLGNPWTCTVRFKNGKRARLRVQVLDDGTYSGRYVGVAAAGANGCCIDLPGTR